MGVNWAENFGLEEGTLGGVAADITGTAVTGMATHKVASSLYGNLKTVVNSPKGRKWLLKRVGKSAAKKIIGGTMAGGGIASWLTFLGGVGLTIKDIHSIFSGGELNEIVKEIEEEGK